ncbi:hypothetical protein Sjap_025537 [Stephania japonica]|uniref:Uncharacterized protein n=1 Tax=Stephania japonica TaxID=461633 RepID=A0AAP0HI15_9MAGN
MLDRLFPTTMAMTILLRLKRIRDMTKEKTDTACKLSYPYTFVFVYETAM